MTVSTKHTFVSGKVDGADASQVQPSHWNQEHQIKLNSSMVMGRQSGGFGVVEELPASPAGLAMLAAANVQTQRQLLGGLPPGAIIAFGGNAAPAGFLFCYGQAVNRGTYATLYGVVGTTYGSGDGSTTFNLPDLRGRVPAGGDAMGGSPANRLTGFAGGVGGSPGQAGGSESHSLATGQLPAHTHPFSGTSAAIPDHTHTVPNGAGGAGSDFILTPGTAAGTTATGSGGGVPGGVAVSGTTGPSGSDTAHNNVQPTLVVNYLIYTG